MPRKPLGLNPTPLTLPVFMRSAVIARSGVPVTMGQGPGPTLAPGFPQRLPQWILATSLYPKPTRP